MHNFDDNQREVKTNFNAQKNDSSLQEMNNVSKFTNRVRLRLIKHYKLYFFGHRNKF